VLLEPVRMHCTSTVMSSGGQAMRGVLNTAGHIKASKVSRPVVFRVHKHERGLSQDAC